MDREVDVEEQVEESDRGGGEETAQVNFLNPGKLLQVPLLVKAVRVRRALLDSGTVFSIVGKGVVDNAGIIINEEETVEVGVYGGYEIKTIGTVDLNVEWADIKLRGKFHVLDHQDAKYDMIIGMNFMKEYQMIIDLAQHTIKIEKGKEEVLMNLIENGECSKATYNRVSVFAEKDFTLKAN